VRQDLTGGSGAGGDDIQLVTFRVAGQDFAFNIFQVERILRWERPTPLPKAPDFLEGMLTYQGAPIPVVDLRKRFNVEAPVKEETRVIVVEWDAGRVGVIVDAVAEVLRVPAAEVTPPPGIVRGLAAEYISGIVSKNGKTVVVLNTGKLLTSKEKIALEAIAAQPQKHKVKT